MPIQVVKSDYEVGIAIGFAGGAIFAMVFALLNSEFHFWPDWKIPFFIVMVIMVHILFFFVGTWFALKERVKNKRMD